MAAQVILALALTACAPGVSIHPDIYCTGRVNAGLTGSWSAAVSDLAEKCGPMVSVKIESWSGQ